MLRLFAATLAVACFAMPAFADGACTPLAAVLAEITAGGNTVIGLEPVANSHAALLLWIGADGTVFAKIVAPAAQTGEPCVLDGGRLAFGTALDMPPPAKPVPKPAVAPTPELGI